MNNQRATSILANQTSLAQKVFKCVPMQQWWTVQEISAEMGRQRAHNNSTHALNGCLAALREAGLVNQQSNRYQSAVHISVTPKSIGPMGQIDDKTAPVPPSLVERLMAQAQSLRDQAERLDLLAMEIDDEITRAGKAGSEKLRMLRELLSE